MQRDVPPGELVVGELIERADVRAAIFDQSTSHVDTNCTSVLEHAQ